MVNNKLKFTTLLLLVTALTTCKPKMQLNESFQSFKHVEINITINGELNVQNCAKWFIDFSRIKRTVVYKDKIICVGLNGGFACINRLDMKHDTAFEKKLNTDFFTNASVFQDTLFAEKFGKIFYWNMDQWSEYSYSLPIKYFDLLYEDKTYAFYSSCGGEFGSILFAYNKTTKETKAEFTDCPNSVIKTNSGYYIGTHLYHMLGGSYSYTIKDIEKLKITDAAMRNDEGLFDREPRFAFLHDTSIEARNNQIPFRFFYPKEIMVVSSFESNGKMYHIIDSKEYKKDREQRFIGVVLKDTLRIIDSIENCTAETAIHFNNTSIINEEFYGQGFTMVRNDTIFKVTFKTLHQNYRGPRVEGYNLSTDQSKIPSSMKEYTFNYESGDWTPKPGQAQREIEFGFRSKYKIIGRYGYGQDGNYIYINNEKSKLRFFDQWNFISTIFTYDNRLFIFFRNLGNIGFKYGLIEITDIDKFAQTYKE